MLYKKTYRQYLRKWKVGRRFRHEECGNCGNVYRVTRKPYIDGRYITTDCIDERHYEYDFGLIYMTGDSSGQFWYNKNNYNDVEWLGD